MCDCRHYVYIFIDTVTGRNSLLFDGTDVD